MARVAAPRAVQEQVRPHRHLVLLIALRDPDVGHEVAGAGGRVLRPGVLRLQAPDPELQASARLLEVVGFFGEAVTLRALVAPAAAPLLLATLATLGLRLALWGGERAAWQAAVELALFAAAFLVLALPRERALIGELRAAVGRGGEDRAGEHDGDERQRGHLPVPVDG